jgi:hypothetical protein
VAFCVRRVFFIHVGWCLYCKIKRSDEETKAKGLSCCEA